MSSMTRRGGQVEKSFNPDAIRQRFQKADDPGQWRSLEELAKTANFQEWLKYEFPAGADQWVDSVTRRGFLKLMAASLGLAGLTACVRYPEEKIVPYVDQPQGMTPGIPQFYASAVLQDGYANGVLVESHEGRPTKMEGNPDHPASLGATDIFGQASVLDLYDPDRAQVITFGDQIKTWSDFTSEIEHQLHGQEGTQGAKIRLLTGTVTSPTLADQIGQFLSAYPNATWHQYQPVTRDSILEGARLAFGRAVATRIDFSQADVILSLDADFLAEGPERVRYARDFAARRKVREGQTDMNRLYVAEPSPTLTGSMADHRLPLQAARMDGLARAVAKELGLDIGVPADLPAQAARWASRVAADLKSASGRAVVLAGRGQPAEVHALVHAINHALGAVGTGVTYSDPVEAAPEVQSKSLQDLVSAIKDGQVEFLVVIGVNPAYTAPADLNFADVVKDVPFKVYQGLYVDETAALADWYIPAAHPLETWSDARAYDGTTTVVQPLIEPLYSGKSEHELLASMTGQADATSHDIVKAYWQANSPEGADFERFWRQSLHDGMVAGSALPAIEVSLQDGRGGVSKAPSADTVQDLEIVFRPDPTIWDGASSNNGWLQELPKPMTKITWDNSAWVAPATADQMGLDNEHVVELSYQGRKVRAPVWVMPGQAPGTVTVFLGYGRELAGRVGQGIGYNAYQLRTTAQPWFDSGLKMRDTGDRYTLATTQNHHTMEGRDLVRVDDLTAFTSGQIQPEEPQTDKPSLYNQFSYEDGYAWGMSIDLSACTGCNACVAACVAENNIPVVGKEQVAIGREMQWLRVDSYFAGSPETPEIYNQAVPCMQCENAPCEVVCPVGATVHSAEGLNDMVYNRCIGTRYCSNNCPYKVRRFNFLQFADETTESLKMVRNPDVTVRSRGVMEKCTYCTQRITKTRIKAEEEGREVMDGEIQTACQQACPTQAITFGNINDDQSRVAGLKAQKHNYTLLAELNTRPRTTYLYKFRNANPKMAKLDGSA
jgi:MoCo/4Fe-4S cofactor protein with predicted Tat translocation signal